MFTDMGTWFISPVQQLPLVGLRVSQSASSVIDQASVPAPEFCISNVWFEGLDPACAALKSKLEGLGDMVGDMVEDGGGVGCSQPLIKLVSNRAIKARKKTVLHRQVFCIIILLFYNFIYY